MGTYQRGFKVGRFSKIRVRDWYTLHRQYWYTFRTSTTVREQAVALVHRALDGGVTYFDTARAYGPSESYYGAAFASRREGRDRITLATKVHARDYDGAWRSIEKSLGALQTDRVDCIQIHNVGTLRDLEEIFSSKGVLKAVQAARDQKICRFIGITGHTDPDAIAEGLRRFPFDTTLIALNPADKLYKSFIERVLPMALEKGVGVIGMKVPARGRILSHVTIQEALGYVWSQAGVSCAIVGCDSIFQLEENVKTAATFKPFSTEELAKIEARVKPLDPQNPNFYQERR